MLNHRAYDGFFQDDDLNTLIWAPSLSLREYLVAFAKPAFDTANFRPSAHIYYTLMGRAFGMDYPPWVTPVFAIHLANALLLYFLMRKLSIGTWQALAATAFFTLSATARDTYWKPMYVFDLLCATFSLASILLFAWRRWVLSFVAFWCAYKSKELAVMLPAVLLLYEFWFGQKRFLPLIPFFLASLSFGIQGILFNPNKDNDYTLRFTLASLRTTIPFYAERFLFLPLSGLALLALAGIPDRRVWFGLAACVLFLFTLLFLPGRLFEAYTYLPLSCAAIAIAGAASRLNPVWIWALVLLWLPWNARELRNERNNQLAHDDEAAAFVDQVQNWSAKHPAVSTLVYTSLPSGYHHWGVTGAWNIAHRRIDMPAYYIDWAEAKKALAEQTVALASWKWDGNTGAFTVQIHLPGQ